MKTIEEIWFGELQDAPSRVNGRSNSSPLHEKSQLLGKVSVIMGVSSQFRDRQSPLEELLHKVRK
jgi:cohesin loading factor subunit SCC2